MNNSHVGPQESEASEELGGYVIENILSFSRKDLLAERRAGKFRKKVGHVYVVSGIALMLYAFFFSISGWLIDSLSQAIVFLQMHPERPLAGLLGLILLSWGMEMLRKKKD